MGDIVGVITHAMRNESVVGPMNAVGPRPVTNSDFTRLLGVALRRPTFFPMPATALHLAFGEMSEILLASQRVVPRVAERSGYEFLYTEIAQALDAVLRPTKRSAVGKVVR